MVQPSCVHTAVSAVKDDCAVRAMRNEPEGVWTTAALPTAESGELLSTFRLILPALTAALTAVSAGSVLGPVELPPPQASKAEAIDAMTSP